METIQELIDDPAIWWTLLTFSVVVFLASLIAIPWIIVRLPADYFDHRRRRSARLANNTIAHYALLIMKNLAGVFFILIGISMLVLPGQGLLTILIGLSLVNFPGKYRLERYIVSRRPVFRSLNWLRTNANKRPFAIRKPARNKWQEDQQSKIRSVEGR